MSGSLEPMNARACTSLVPFFLGSVIPLSLACSGEGEPSDGAGPSVAPAAGRSTAPVTGGDAATGGAGSGGAETGRGSGTVNEQGWRLVWSDEFDGTEIDSSKWEHEVNCWGGGNAEQQCYVADPKNSFVIDGKLHIVALEDNPSGAIGGPGDDATVVNLPYSSARLRTINKGDFKYGRIEAKLQLPSGQGLWPAFWMLPTDSVYGGWAAFG